MGRSALLVMDVQRILVERYQGMEYLGRLRTAIDGARAASVPVIYVAVGFRPGYPEVNLRNKMFSGVGSGGSAADAEAAMQIHPDVAPEPGDVVVIKKRVSAFTGSDLDVVLRSGGIDSLVLTGIATSGVVLSTLRQAADLDFGLTVLADGCLDGDPEVHRVLVEKVFPRQADVLSIEEWVESFKAGPIGVRE